MEREFSDLFPKSTSSSSVSRVRTQKWFVYYLYSQDASGELKQHFSGTGIQHFTGEVLARFKIPLPPLSGLRSAVATFDALAKETQRLAGIYERKLVLLEELKKALLHRAFCGEL